MRKIIQQMHETNDSGSFDLYEVITDLEKYSLAIELKSMNAKFVSTKKILYINSFTNEDAMYEAYRMEVGKLLEGHYLRDLDWLVSQLYSRQDFGQCIRESHAKEKFPV